MKKILFISLILLYLSGCDLFISNKDSNYSEITISLPNSRALIDEAGVYELIVSGTDFEDVTITSETGTLTTEVLIGDDRTFTVNIYNSDRTLLLYTGETTENVISSGLTNIDITLSQSAGQIIYHSNSQTGGSVPANSDYYNFNTEITVLDNTNSLVKTGFSFFSWNTLEDGSGTTYFPDSIVTISSGDVHLYADWFDPASISADAYEADNNKVDADTYNRTISLNETQYHTIDIAGDFDWMKFDATSGVTYTFYTTETGHETSVDTYMYLYDVDGTTLIEEDDDDGQDYRGLCSAIVFPCTTTGTYYLVIKDLNSGGYSLDYFVSVVDSAYTPPAYDGGGE
ncbi:MAG: membrane lipoprotein lipid attachment site-containing protein [Spirochaetaceae bacterium]